MKKAGAEPRRLGPIHLMDLVPQPLALVDVRSGKVVQSNTALDELILSKRPIRAQNLVDLFVAESQLTVQAMLDLCQEQPPPRVVRERELCVKRGSGRRTVVDLEMTPTKIGQKKVLLCFFYDQTEVKKQQVAREAAQQEITRLSKLADIGLLAAGIGHELNNPLMIIQGYAENLDLLLESANPSPHEMRTQVGEILKATERMARVIHQMGSIVSRDTPAFETCDLSELALNMVRFFGNELRHHQIQVSFEMSEPLIARCNTGQIEQVILNILSNARHALLAKTADRRIRISGKAMPTGPIISIWNNGPEIPQEIQSKLMTPFFTTKEVGQGTGLGLAISHGILQAHAGKISFQSTPEGTEFSLSFPVPPQGQRVVAPRTSSGEVLIVDDDIAALDVLAMKLNSFGLKVHRATSASAALEVLRLRPEICAVYSDIRMPDVDGLSLLKEIKLRHENPPLLFAVSGYRLSEGTIVELSRHGVVDVLQKPMNPQAFAQTLQKIKATVSAKKSA